MDHNDIALGFYVLGSVWAYAEYNRSSKWYWVLLIGLFAGGAILNKWLLGLFVYLIWGTHILLTLKQGPAKSIGLFALSVLICCAVFVPWQIYILHNWPAEARYEYEYNRRHISEVLQGHGGSVWYYASRMSLYLTSIWFFSIPGVAYAFIKRETNKKLLISILGSVFFVFCFFSFVVKTKVLTHFFFVIPFLMIFMGQGLAALFQKINRLYITLPALLILVYSSIKPFEIKAYFSSSNAERHRKLHNTEIYKRLREKLPPKYKVVMNLPSFEDVELMFYHNDITAYHWWVTEKDLEEMARKKIPVAVFRNHGDYNLPDYVNNYPYLFIIDEMLD